MLQNHSVCHLQAAGSGQIVHVRLKSLALEKGSHVSAWLFNVSVKTKQFWCHNQLETFYVSIKKQKTFGVAIPTVKNQIVENMQTVAERWYDVYMITRTTLSLPICCQQRDSFSLQLIAHGVCLAAILN